MIFQMYSIRDHLTGFMTPVLEQNDAAALRNFTMACDKAKSSSTLMAWRPSDFALFRIASFDSLSGELIPESPAVLICNGDSVGGASDA